MRKKDEGWDCLGEILRSYKANPVLFKINATKSGLKPIGDWILSQSRKRGNRRIRQGKKPVIC